MQFVEEIRKARNLTSGVIGVNIMSVLTDFSDMVRTSIEERIDIIFSGAGLPLDLPSYLGKGCQNQTSAHCFFRKSCQYHYA